MPKRQVDGQGDEGTPPVMLGVSVAAAALLASPLLDLPRDAQAEPHAMGPVPSRVLHIDAWGPVRGAVGGPIRETADEAHVGTEAPALREQDDAYYRRLDIHRAASYALLPLFALQYFAGDQLYRKSRDAPEWAKVGHRVGATGIAALFAVNVSTGVPNLIAARHEPRERGRRTLHGSLMLLATAGFVATGILSDRAESSPDDRALHRTVALSSMGVATVGFLTMTDLFRRD